MESHGGGRSTTGGEDPAETGLEEAVWKLELESGEDSYPERPDEPDCIHFLRTGYCGYGSSCRFNHPRDRGKTVEVARPSGGEYPERAGQPVCQYYMRTGSCKFGASCKYHHPKQGGGSGSSISLNYYGFPLRPGEKECAYYMRTGQCKFGATCKFNHPEPIGIQVPAALPQPQVPQIPPAAHPPALYPPVQSPSDPSSQQFVMRPNLYPGPYMGPYGHVMLPTGIIPVPGGWGHYPAPGSHIAPLGAQLGVGPSSVSGMTALSPSALAYTGPYQTVQSTLGPSSSSHKELPFPQRPDQPECQYYMRNGECKFGSSCKYHHPLEVAAEKNDVVVLSPMGLPLRPGASTCTHYTQHGCCKFGPACKYNHPMGSLSYSPSASSLADMPVAPLPVGSVMGTLAPSSSSSNLRPELISASASASGKESVSTSVLSSTMKPSESIGVVYSSGGSAPHSTSQQSGALSGPSNGSSTSNSSTSSSSTTGQIPTQPL